MPKDFDVKYRGRFDVTDYYNWSAQVDCRSSLILYNDSRRDFHCLSIGARIPNLEAAMKLLPSLAALSLTLLSVSAPAIAQQDMQHGKDFAKRQNLGEIQRPFLRRHEPQRIDGKTDQSVLRETSTSPPADDGKAPPTQGLVPVQGRERLSPEERRQLRRDINAAGRDIYRRNKPE